ncbi:MAG: hypothetical protein K2H44_00295 [Muribaculaceae bacterium]|nr:hypothetical protein [Muribaculaceae bacterium]
MNSNYLKYLILTVFLGGISLGLSSQEVFQRGLEQHSFIPKGQWITGVSVSYTQSDQNNYKFFIIENLNGDTYSFKVSPMLMYAFKDNMAAGGRLAYARSLTRLRNASVIIDSETSYDITNLYRLSHTYYGMAAFRNYISLGDSKRFGLFNELQVQVGGGESKLLNGVGEELTGVFERDYSLDIGLAPGMCMFLTNYSAIEVNVGVLGFAYHKTKAITDQIYVAHTRSQSANFNVNLFSITFGVVFYL